MRKCFLCFVILSVLFTAVSCAEKRQSDDSEKAEKQRRDKGLSLKVTGDPDSGYSVNILYNSKPIANHNGGGEFSATFENGDYSLREDIRNWKASSWTGDDKKVQLVGSSNLNNLFVEIYAKITYEVINEHVVKKTIELEQNNMSRLFYQLTNRLQPLDKPKSYWSFDHENCTGGNIYESYPAAGFKTDGGIAVGLLTDSGYRNLWTRTNRRRHIETTGRLRKVLNCLPDPQLLRVQPIDKSTGDEGYVEFNFGQVADYQADGEIKILKPNKAEFTGFNGAEFKAASGQGDGQIITIRGKDLVDDMSGVIIPVKLDDISSYTLKFDYKSDCKIGTRLWNTQHTRDIGLYYDDLPASPNGWRSFSGSHKATGSNSGNQKLHLYIGKSYADANSFNIKIRNLQFIEKKPVLRCYHPLNIGEPVTKTMYIFAEPADTLGDLRLASQVRLAEGRGFEGTQAEKIFYADQQMLLWICEPRDLTAHVVPSLGYSPDMYTRDSFWTVLACHDKKLSESIWSKWAGTQDDSGCIDTIITPYVGSEENIDNDVTWYFVIWAYVNHKQYGTEIDKSVIQKAIDYCRITFDPNRTGVCQCRTPAWIDTIWIESKPNFAVNQGIYANVLRCAKQLGADVSEKELRGAVEQYRRLYDPDRGYVVFAKELPDIISPSVLMGEFISFWLWDEPILSDKAVIDTLNKFRPLAYGNVPCIVNSDYTYFTKEDHPFSGGNRWKGGEYTNGGSWLLYEYQAYVAGLKHGWKPAKQRMQNLIKSHFNTAKNEPLSHEWLPTSEDVEVASGTQVFGWNCFMITANEVAGFRRPQQDPDWQK